MKFSVGFQKLPVAILQFLLLTPLLAHSVPGFPETGNKRQTFAQCRLAMASRAAGREIPNCDFESIKNFAADGDVYAQNQVGIASVLAVNPAVDTKSAVQWFEKAARKGYLPAQVNLGVLNENGWGTPRNYAAALYWFHRAADQRYPRAYYNLGILYLQGLGVRRDLAEAAKYFELGAKAGDPFAETNLGYLYDSGVGTKQDYTSAALWYRKAAEQGNSLAQNDLADLYLRGLGVPQEDATALRLFRAAAEQGQPAASIKLGYMLSAGRGATRDIEAACEWVLTGVLAGDRRGEELLHQIEQQLTSPQRNTCKSRARQRMLPSTPQFSALLQP
jgi:uncharacterized protein